MIGVIKGGTIIARFIRSYLNPIQLIKSTRFRSVKILGQIGKSP